MELLQRHANKTCVSIRNIHGCGFDEFSASPTSTPIPSKKYPTTPRAQPNRRYQTLKEQYHADNPFPVRFDGILRGTTVIQ